nr:putative exostosin-like protein [Tanacetum cinerariifolium]
MSALEYRTILKYRLMIPLFPVDEPCPVCRKVCLDSFGEHAVHCRELPGFKYRHDLVRDVLYDVLKRAGISSKKEAPAPVNFLTDPLEGRSTLRPADILVFGWAGGKHACVDLTGVSPLVGFRENGFVAGQAALKAESSKVAKHEKACLENQHVFIPFAFDTFGFLAPETEKFLNRVQRVVQSNCSTPKTQNFIFSRIGFAIQKGVAAQLVARLPAILLTKANKQSNLAEEDLEPTILMAILDDSDKGNQIKEVEEQKVSLHEDDVGYKETNIDSKRYLDNRSSNHMTGVREHFKELDEKVSGKEHMAWQTDYCIMKEEMSILGGRKSIPGMNSSEREMER